MREMIKFCQKKAIDKGENAWKIQNPTNAGTAQLQNKVLVYESHSQQNEF
jgi:hypothetical protein